MKKITTVLLAIAMLFVLLAPVSEASTYTLKNKSLKMPNLYSTTIAKQLKSGTYKYYGVKLGNTKKYMYNMWGSAASATVSRGYGSTDGMYTYGNDWQLTASASYPSTKASTDKLIVDYISISDSYHKHEYSKIKSVFGTPQYIYTAGKYRSISYNDVLDISFTKVGTKWYVEDITSSKYNF
ncbi:hypothetical protein [Macrococcus carouselicus]|uniref:Surface layer protein A domain-containing protein n=1 Tax=Macrococcus carouselicus TaxID=69969 RepID=A0A9Q8FNW6_9STAP|nr:hypothetical protein [Macrococcus carouselicus]TDL96625.1 hypothetical protein ERX40_09740 [Macrococcus carouselicus]